MKMSKRGEREWIAKSINWKTKTNEDCEAMWRSYVWRWWKKSRRWKNIVLKVQVVSVCVCVKVEVIIKKILDYRVWYKHNQRRLGFLVVYIYIVQCMCMLKLRSKEATTCILNENKGFSPLLALSHSRHSWFSLFSFERTERSYVCIAFLFHTNIRIHTYKERV